jgi:hypothetical protein
MEHTTPKLVPPAPAEPRYTITLTLTPREARYLSSVIIEGFDWHNAEKDGAGTEDQWSALYDALVSIGAKV